jgi:hypothetical protein
MASISPHPSSADSDDDDDGAAYKMESFGTIPTVTPSRDGPLLRRNDGSPGQGRSTPTSSTLGSVGAPGIVGFAPPPPPKEFTVQNKVDKDDNSRKEEDDSVQSLIFIRSPKSTATHSSSEVRGKTGNEKSAASNLHNSNSSNLQNSNLSLDIIVEARKDEPPSRHDVYYASADTFPTSNVFPPSTTSPTINRSNRRDVMSSSTATTRTNRPRHHASIDTLPMSNISNSESHLTAVMSVGETTTSDLTTTTAGTFNTSNAVVVHGTEDKDDDDDDEKHPKGVVLHIAAATDENDIPLDELFAQAQRKGPQHAYNPQPGDGEFDDDDEYEIDIDMDRRLNVILETDPSTRVVTATSTSRNNDNSNSNNNNSKRSALTSSDMHDLESPPIPPTESKSRGTPSFSTTSSGAVSSLGFTNSNNSGRTHSGHTHGAGGAAASSLSSPDSGSDSKMDRELDKVDQEQTSGVGSAAAAAAASSADTITKDATPKTNADDNNNDSGDSPFAVVHTDFCTRDRAPPSSSSKPYRLYFCRGVVVATVLLIVILSASLFYTRDNGSSGNAGSPTLAPITIPKPGSTTTTDPRPTTAPSSVGSEGPPVDNSEEAPTVTPSVTRTDNFQISAIFDGQANGQRLGTVVSLSSGGDFVAASSLDATEAIRSFSFSGTSEWLPFADLSVGPSLLGESGARAPLDMSVATSRQGFPCVAVSTALGFQVYEYQETEWTERGQVVRWQPSDLQDENGDPVASSTAIRLSSNADVLAAGHVSQSGRMLMVRIFSYDETTQRWYQRGDSIQRDRVDGASPFLSILLSLSGDGNVVSVGDWLIGNPQVILEMYQWRGSEWRPMGAHFSLPWGPASVALSQSGSRMAQINIALGAAYEWDDMQWIKLGSGFVGGNSISLADDGSRILVGDALQGIATVLDYGEGEWQETSVLRGTNAGRFGESVAMGKNGNILAVGSPLVDLDEANVGQFSIFE